MRSAETQPLHDSLLQFLQQKSSWSPQATMLTAENDFREALAERKPWLTCLSFYGKIGPAKVELVIAGL
ncbi:MAG: hypothetical protein ACJ797_21385 [Ktedonobacteraceae bacterium]